MVHTEQENNGCAGGSGNGSGIMAFNVDFTANGSAIKVETSGTNSTGLDGYSLRTYKRRKSLKATEGGKGLEDSVSQITEKVSISFVKFSFFYFFLNVLCKFLCAFVFCLQWTKLCVLLIALFLILRRSCRECWLKTCGW